MTTHDHSRDATYEQRIQSYNPRPAYPSYLLTKTCMSLWFFVLGAHPEKVVLSTDMVRWIC